MSPISLKMDVAEAPTNKLLAKKHLFIFYTIVIPFSYNFILRLTSNNFWLTGRTKHKQIAKT